MAHQEQVDWCLLVKHAHPEHFIGVKVLDIGSLDINGNNRYLFDNCDYTGIDIGAGKNVDIVCSGHLFKSDDLFDVVISTECLEHDKYYAETLNNAYNLLKVGGLLLFSCAAPGRPEHGTTRTSKGDSPFTNDYYKNLSEHDIREVWEGVTSWMGEKQTGSGMDALFSTYKFKTRKEFPQDLYFYGIKK
jgi:SAM-dependent methyltransferase